MDKSPDRFSRKRHCHGDDSLSFSSLSLVGEILGRPTRSQKKFLLSSDDDSDEGTHVRPGCQQTGSESSKNSAKVFKRHDAQSPHSCEKALLLPESDDNSHEIIHCIKPAYSAAEVNAFGNPSRDVADQHGVQNFQVSERSSSKSSVCSTEASNAAVTKESLVNAVGQGGALPSEVGLDKSSSGGIPNGEPSKDRTAGSSSLETTNLQKIATIAAMKKLLPNGVGPYTTHEKLYTVLFDDPIHRARRCPKPTPYTKVSPPFRAPKKKVEKDELFVNQIVEVIRQKMNERDIEINLQDVFIVVRRLVKAAILLHQTTIYPRQVQKSLPSVLAQQKQLEENPEFANKIVQAVMQMMGKDVLQYLATAKEFGYSTSLCEGGGKLRVSRSGYDASTKIIPSTVTSNSTPQFNAALSCLVGISKHGGSFKTGSSECVNDTTMSTIPSYGALCMSPIYMPRKNPSGKIAVAGGKPTKERDAEENVVQKATTEKLEEEKVVGKKSTEALDRKPLAKTKSVEFNAVENQSADGEGNNVVAKIALNYFIDPNKYKADTIAEYANTKPSNLINNVVKHPKFAVASDSVDSITGELWQQDMPEDITAPVSFTDKMWQQNKLVDSRAPESFIGKILQQEKPSDIRVPAFLVNESLRQQMCAGAPTSTILTNAASNGFCKGPALTTTVGYNVSALLDPSKASSIWRVVIQKPAVGWKCASCRANHGADKKSCAVCGAANPAETLFPEADAGNDVFKRQEPTSAALNSRYSPNYAEVRSSESCVTSNVNSKTPCANCGTMKTTLKKDSESKSVGDTCEVQSLEIFQKAQSNAKSHVAGSNAAGDCRKSNSAGTAPFFAKARLTKRIGNQPASDVEISSSFKSVAASKPLNSGKAHRSTFSELGSRPVGGEISSQDCMDDSSPGELRNVVAMFMDERPSKRARADPHEASAVFGAASDKKKTAIAMDHSQSSRSSGIISSKPAAMFDGDRATVLLGKSSSGKSTMSQASDVFRAAITEQRSSIQKSGSQQEGVFDNEMFPMKTTQPNDVLPQSAANSNANQFGQHDPHAPTVVSRSSVESEKVLLDYEDYEEMKNCYAEEVQQSQPSYRGPNGTSGADSDDASSSGDESDENSPDNENVDDDVHAVFGSDSENPAPSRATFSMNE